MERKIRILVIARWPLGGIRTYMRYMFKHFPANYRLTILASSTLEDSALQDDALTYNADINLVKITNTREFLIQIYKELKIGDYDLLLSQGFVSAFSTGLANIFFRIPHILTIHGILEPQYFGHHLRGLKKWYLGWVLKKLTVLYAVSNDILEHLYKQYPPLRVSGPKAIVILNGIDLENLKNLSSQNVYLRQSLGIDESTFLFGFLGRFMPQKGFDLLIKAFEIILKQNPDCSFNIIAVGSGDYVREYQADIRRKRLEKYFHFLPFQSQVFSIYPQLDAVIMPSRWEACPLLPMESLSMGVPLIVSDCIGLREVAKGTPALVFPSENVQRMSELMLRVMKEDVSKTFKDFSLEARARFDVAKSARELVSFLGDMLERQ